MKTREALIESSRQHKQFLKQELSSFAENTTNIAKKLAIIGAVAAGAYLFLRYITDDEEETKVVKNENRNNSSGWQRVGKVLAQQALLHLLSDSKNKIQEYLTKLEQDERGNP